MDTDGKSQKQSTMTHSPQDSDKHSYGGTLKDDATHFLLSEHLADVKFAFKDNPVKLPGHRLLLAMRSEVFRAMFYGPMAECSDTVMIEDMEISTMKLLLKYMYSDDAELDGDNVMGCLYAANKYALGGLIEMCITFLEKEIGIGNVCTILGQAIFYGETSLKAKCFEYIMGNPNDVFETEGFRKLSYDSLLGILTCDHLSSDESVNFVAAKVWALDQCKEKNLDTTPENIRACLGDVLFSIRFPLMAIDTFAKLVTPTRILKSKEMLILYHYFATTSVKEEVRMIEKFSCNRRTVRIDNRKLPVHRGWFREK